MPVVRFFRNFDWKPTPSYTIGYKAGQELLVTTRCSDAAIAKGRAELVKKPRRRRRSNADQDERG